MSVLAIPILTLLIIAVAAVTWARFNRQISEAAQELDHAVFWQAYINELDSQHHRSVELRVDGVITRDFDEFVRDLNERIRHRRRRRYILAGPRDRTRTGRATDGSWFYLAMFFVPREIRAPWFDHILDDRRRAADEGRGRLFIAAMTVSQCLSLLIHHVGGLVLDILTPFKSRISRGE